MPRILRIPLSGFAFLAFYTGAAVIAWILLPLTRLRTRKLSAEDQQAALDRLLMRGYRSSLEFMGLLGLMHFSLPNFEDAQLPPPPWVIVANHPTLIDVLFVKATLPGVCVLTKAALFRSPTLGRLFRAAGDFKGPEHDEQSFGSTGVFDIFVEKLQAGRSVLVFPEGTRSPAWRLRRFRRGAAEAAVRAGVPLVPIFVLSDPPVLKKGDKWYDMPDQVPILKLELLPALETAGADSRKLTADVREQLAARLEQARVASTERHRQ